MNIFSYLKELITRNPEKEAIESLVHEKCKEVVDRWFDSCVDHDSDNDRHQLNIRSMQDS